MVVKRAASTRIRANASLAVPADRTILNQSLPIRKRKRSVDINLLQSLGVGQLFTLGTNVTGQLGYVASQRKFPFQVPTLAKSKFVQVESGGMHTVALNDDGNVYTFGCNDEGALGRDTLDPNSNDHDEKSITQERVDLPEKIKQISAGSSHSAALSETGKVYVWGVFRKPEGIMGLIPNESSPVRLPVQANIEFGRIVIKIASGNDHLVMLTQDGLVLTIGSNSCGQLGRELFRNTRSVASKWKSTDEENESGKEKFYLTPMPIAVHKAFVDIWAGGDSTFCKTKRNLIFVCGLNYDNQLGTEKKSNLVKIPIKSSSFGGKIWKQIAAGEQHTLAMDSEGKVYSLGRHDDGRLGLPDVTESVSAPTIITALEDKVCSHISCGDAVSYAVTESGELYCWGFGENWQLGNGEQDDCLEPTKAVSKRDHGKIDGKVLHCSAGGQHCALIISNNVNGVE